MSRGTVKWFNNVKGFGFILPEDGTEELFAHYSAIEMDGYKTLKAGQAVTYEAETGAKGLHAVRIKPEHTVPSPSADKKDSVDVIEEPSAEFL